MVKQHNAMMIIRSGFFGANDDKCIRKLLDVRNTVKTVCGYNVLTDDISKEQ